MSPKKSASPATASVSPLITKACDMCRKKKIRCQPTENSCVRCIKYKTLCHFTPISMKRGPRRPPGQKRVEELKNRLKMLEEKLKRASQASSHVMDPDTNTDLEISPQAESEAAPNEENSVVTWTAPPKNNDFQSLFELETSSPELRESMYELINGVQVSGVGMTSPAILLNTILPKDWNPTSDLQLTRVNDIFSRRILKPLPPKSEALYLIKKSFYGIHLPYPLFDEASFIKRFESDESPYVDAGWWACLNVVLALAHRLRSMVCMNSQEEDREAWGYFQNALGVATELTMLNNTLTAVQALVGMAIIIQGSPNVAPYSSLTAAAMRLAQTLNLHRSQENPGLPKEVIEERKRVFWIAYFLDKDVSLRTHQPPIQDEENMDVELPIDNSSSSLGFDFMIDRIHLAKIQGQIYKRLLSVPASRQPYPQRVAAITELESKLQKWKNSVPIDFDRDYHLTTSLPVPFPAPAVHAIILRLVYFNSLNAIHSSIPYLNEADGDRAAHRMELHGILPPPITFVAEARKAIKLLHFTPQGDYACIWVVLHIFVSATKTLLNHLLREPGDVLAMSDLQLIDPMLKLLGMLAKGETRSMEVIGMFEECTELFAKARERVEDAMNLAVPWTSSSGTGQRQEKESVEEFIRRIESISAGYDDVPFDLDPGLLPRPFRPMADVQFGTPPLDETGLQFFT